MKRLLGGALFLCSCILLLGAVGAGEEEKKEKKKFDPEVVFKKLDANSDGKLSKTEFLKMADRVQDEEKAEKFRGFLTKVYDKVSNGSDGITLEQFREARTMMREQFKKKREEDNK